MPAAGTFRNGPSKGKSQSYSDFSKSKDIRKGPFVSPETGGAKEPIRRTGAMSSALGFNAAPSRLGRNPQNGSSSKRGAMPNLEDKAEAVKRRLKKNSMLKKSGTKLTAAMKARSKKG